MPDRILTPCNVARAHLHLSGRSGLLLPGTKHVFTCNVITTLISSGDCTLQCHIAACNVACGSGIVTVNSPSGSTLQCDTWLWDDMPLNSPKRTPYWNSTSDFHFHTSPQSTCHSVPVCEILSESDHPRREKNDVMSIFNMACLSHLGL